MFTGIVEEMGRFAGAEGHRFTFEAKVVTEDAERGSSISVNGVCLTTVAIGDGWWQADMVEETLARTALGRLKVDDPVNLERPLRLVDRLGGHLVQGHVDAVGAVLSPAPELRVALGPSGPLSGELGPSGPLSGQLSPSGRDHARYLAVKGSVAVDGVSLTVVDAFDEGFTVAVIPHTAATTTLGRRQPGDLVNLEFDVIAKYVERLLRQ